MRQQSPVRRVLETIGVGTVAVGLVAAQLIGIGADVATAAPATVSSVDFNDQTLGTWMQSGGGGATLTYVDDGAGGYAVAVNDRDADYVGIQSPTADTLGMVAGETYTLSMRVKLADGTPDTSVRFVMKPAYSWIGDTTVKAGEWTEVTGTYTVAADADLTTLQLYVGTSNIDGVSAYTYLIDDVLITGGPGVTPPATGTLLHNDFDSQSLGALTRSGGTDSTLTFVDDGAGGYALAVNDRDADYVGVQTPTADTLGMVAGETYTLSMRVKLADGTPDTSVRFVMKPAYSWIGNTTVKAGEWTEVTGTYTVAADADLTTLQLYVGSSNIDGVSAYTYLIDDVLITGLIAPGTALIDTDFETGTLEGWAPRDDGHGTATLTPAADAAHAGAYGLRVSDRTWQGQGPLFTVTSTAVAGATYDFSAWVKFEGTPGDMTLSAHTRNAGTDAYSNLVALTGLSSSGWVHVTGTFTMPAFDTVAELYLETKWVSSTDPGNISAFLVDDIVVQTTPAVSIEDLTPLKSTVDFPLGVAIDSRETTGTAAELLLKHFNQVTSENYMKPEAWYDADKNFRENPEATTLMTFAQDNKLRVYGHTLVWHSQTPDWFFQHDDGTPLTSSPADQDILRQRLHDHITNVAKDLSDNYGLFGSDTNPLVAFDVVNEVVDDGTTYADGLRRSPWYNVLGESFIDLAFQYANEAFNGTYAAPDAAHPISLFINDYNTEQSGKQARLHNLVARLIERGVPVDGVGHQFHLSLSTPVSSLDAALTAFEDLPVVQAVTELDVVVGSAERAKLIDQGYFYRDAFDIFRAHELFSVTVWGLTDGRSWRASNNGKPLLFTDTFQAKYAFFGAAGLDLPATVRTANSFAADADGDYSNGSNQWLRLPLNGVGENAAFQTRWSPDALTVFVTVADATVDATDAVVLETPDGALTFGRDGSGDLTGTAAEVAGGWTAVVELPLTGVAQGDSIQLDVRVVDGDTTAGWNSAGSFGTVTLIEPLSFLEVVETPTAPAIDGAVDAVWAAANTVTTAKVVSGTAGATADVRTLWKGSTLYVLADVTDPVIDTTGSDPWTKDSVELYFDAGNAKNGSYRADDTQIRINADGEVSFGTGDEAAQAARLTSAVTRTATGYRVEAAVNLLTYGGLGTFHGLDFQVNDAADGARHTITNWADPTGAGYQSTAHWGVGELVEGTPVVPVPELELQLSGSSVKAGGTLGVSVTGGQPGEAVQVWLNSTPVLLSSGVMSATGTYAATVTIPAGTVAGAHTVRVLTAAGEASAAITVVLADPGTGGSGNLAATGSDPWALAVLALLLLVVGVISRQAPALRRRR